MPAGLPPVAPALLSTAGQRALQQQAGRWCQAEGGPCRCRQQCRVGRLGTRGGSACSIPGRAVLAASLDVQGSPNTRMTCGPHLVHPIARESCLRMAARSDACTRPGSCPPAPRPALHGQATAQQNLGPVCKTQAAHTRSGEEVCQGSPAYSFNKAQCPAITARRTQKKFQAMWLHREGLCVSRAGAGSAPLAGTQPRLP